MVKRRLWPHQYFTVLLALSLSPLGASATASAQAADPVETIRTACADAPRPCEHAPDLARLLLRHDDESVRARAATLLGELSHPDTEVALRAAARLDTADSVRQAATDALVSWDDEPSTTTLPSARRARRPRRWTDPGVGNTFYASSAFGARPGAFRVKGVGLGDWSLTYGVHENWEVGAHVSLPVFLFRVGPKVKGHWEVSEHVRVGFTAQANAVFRIGDMGDGVVVFGGAGPVVSLGSEAYHVNIHFPFYGFYDTAGEEPAWLGLPSVGVDLRLGSIARFLFEAHIPFGGDDYDNIGGFGEDALLFLLYGVRLHGSRFYGDIGLVVPFFDGEFQIFEYMPLGWPILSFGFTL